MRFLCQCPSPVIALAALLGAVITSRARAADPPGRVGRVSSVSGPVSFRADGTDEWAAAVLNYPVTTGDELWSGTGARAEVHIGSSAVRLAPRSLVDFLDVSDHGTKVRLAQGSLYVRVRPHPAGDHYEVDMPNGAVALLGVGRYRIDVAADGRAGTVTVRDGSAEVVAGGATVSVRAGRSAAVTGLVGAPRAAVVVAVDDWERWCDARDHREDASLSLHYVSAGLVGFEDLDDYGTWRIDATFGPVWVPAVRADWAPYRFGSWAWVAPWGWTWIDDEPWGFAPFHYGRWAFLDGGWAWVPGQSVEEPVYAPALVVFVGGASFGGGVAWFPLAPGEVYVPAYRVSGSYLREVNLTSVKITDVDLTAVNVKKVKYANRAVPGAVTAVSRETFVRGRPVAKAVVRVPAGALARARVVGTTVPIVPATESVLPHAVARRVAPPPTAPVHRPGTSPGRQGGEATVERPRGQAPAEQPPKVRPTPAPRPAESAEQSAPGRPHVVEGKREDRRHRAAGG